MTVNDTFDGNTQSESHYKNKNAILCFDVLLFFFDWIAFSVEFFIFFTPLRFDQFLCVHDLCVYGLHIIDYCFHSVE